MRAHRDPLAEQDTMVEDYKIHCHLNIRVPGKTEFCLLWKILAQL